MARKTKTCAFKRIDLHPYIVMRTCWRPRHHDGDCMDERGSWRHEEENHG